jgi:hypothetical protein
MQNGGLFLIDIKKLKHKASLSKKTGHGRESNESSR